MTAAREMYVVAGRDANAELGIMEAGIAEHASNISDRGDQLDPGG